MIQLKVSMPPRVKGQFTRGELRNDPSVIQAMTVRELVAHTDRTTLLVDDGDHSWRDDESIIQSRFYSADLSRQIRHSGDTECTHSMGAADLLVNLCILPNKNHPLTPAEGAFVQKNHDKKENNRKFVSNAAIVRHCWRGDKSRRMFLLWLLNQMTDSPGLDGPARFAEQVKRANEDKTGCIGELRITEKLEAICRDRLVIAFGEMPFENNVAKTLDYIEQRADMIYKIRSPRSEPLKLVYMSQATKLVEDVLEHLKTKPSEDDVIHISSAYKLLGKLVEYGGTKSLKEIIVVKPTRRQLKANRIPPPRSGSSACACG